MNEQLMQYRDQFVQHLESTGRARATVIAYSKDVEQIIEFLAEKGKNTFDQISSDDIESFKELLKKQRYTGKSISRKINSIKSFFRFLMSESVITENPADIVVHPKYDQAPPRVL